MITQQPEALKLADSLELMLNEWPSAMQAATELRRLHAENMELMNAVKSLVEYDSYSTEYDGRMYDICPACGKQDDEEHSERCSFFVAQKLIAKVEGQP